MPFQLSGTRTVRAYHATSASSPTPDSLDPQGNGTRIVSGKPAGALSNQRSASPAESLSNRKAQSPLRFTHSARSKSGLGCSGRGMAGAASAAVGGGAGSRKRPRAERKRRAAGCRMDEPPNRVKLRRRAAARQWAGSRIAQIGLWSLAPRLSCTMPMAPGPGAGRSPFVSTWS